MLAKEGREIPSTEGMFLLVACNVAVKLEQEPGREAVLFYSSMQQQRTDRPSFVEIR